MLYADAVSRALEEAETPVTGTPISVREIVKRRGIRCFQIRGGGNCHASFIPIGPEGEQVSVHWSRITPDDGVIHRELGVHNPVVINESVWIHGATRPRNLWAALNVAVENIGEIHD